MRNCTILGILLTSVAVSAQQPVEASVHAEVLQAAFAPSRDEVFGHVRFLASDALSGRSAGSIHGEIAARYIEAEFAKLGLKPAGDDGGFVQPIEAMTMQLVGKSEDGRDHYTKRKVTYRNLLAWLPGKDAKLTEEFILIGAHYDHLGVRGDQVFNGADDNASGVAGLLGIARALVEGSIAPRRSILFAAFDAEEGGLRGSRYFVRHPSRSLQKLVTMVNLDMIGRGTFLDRSSLTLPKKMLGLRDHPAVGVLGTSQSVELAAIVRAVFKADDFPVHAPENFPAMIRDVIEKQAAGRSDHAPFEERRVPFVFFSTSENDDYHQPTDTIDKVDAAVLHRIAANVYRVVLAVDALDQRPVFIAPPPAKKAKSP